MATGGIGSYMNHMAHLFFEQGHKVSVISATNKPVFNKIDRGFCTNYLVPACSTELFRKEALKIFEENCFFETVDLIESPEVGACALNIKSKYAEVPLIVKLHTPGVLITKVSNSYQSFFKKLRFVAGALLRGRIDLGYWAKHDKNKSKDPEYIICEKAELILSPSAALKKWAVNFWGIREDKIKVLPNPFVATEDLLQYSLERNSKKICFIGKLSVLKGMFVLTPVMKAILKRHENVRFIIAGRDEYINKKIPSMRGWMQSQLGALNSRIEFTGAINREKVNELLGNCDMCVISSLWENYPTVALEAMAAGCVVIASDAGGIPEIIKNGETGLIFKSRSKMQMTKAIDTLLLAPQKRKLLATSAREQVSLNGNASFVKSVLSFYAETISEKKKTALIK